MPINFGGQNNAGLGTGTGVRGAALFDLHGLGPSTTSVLVNGRRLLRTGLTIEGQQFDNAAQIPMTFVDRIETMKGGGSAIEGIEWLQSEHQPSESPMFGKLDPMLSGATGHSQGGAGACAAARDERIVTIAPIQGGGSCEQMPPSVPTIWFTGSADNIAVPAEIKAVYESVPGPAMYAMLDGATHFTPPGNGGGFRGPVTAWFRAHLMADEDARAMFYGPDCGLCKDPNWSFESRNQ